MTNKVSIITPVLNMANHISACVESVRNQEANVEHIIIDGGSTDGTLDEIQKLSHDSLQVISEPDRGQSDAINKGLNLANGIIFNWLNADDRLKPGALKEVVKSMDEKTVVLLGKCEHINANSGEVETVGQTFLKSSVSATMANYAMAQPSHFYRTDVVRSLGGLNTQLHFVMDMDLWFRYLMKFGIDGIKKTDSVLSEFWLLPEAKSTAQSKNMAQEKYEIFTSVLEKIESPQVLLEATANKASEIRIDYEISQIDRDEFCSEFSWHLLLEAYEKGHLEVAGTLLDLVLQSDRLSPSDAAVWKLRVQGASGQFIKKLRGR